MKNLKIFNSQQFSELKILIDKKEKEWFPVTIVAKVLGYSNPHDAIIRHCKNDGVVKHEVIDDLGRTQEMKFINEGNLYRLIVKSKLPSAEKFERWIFDEVLPSIRKHGMYATDELLNNPDLAIKVFQELKKEREETAKLQQQINVDKPYTNFGKAISNSDDGILIGEYAKLLKNDSIEIGQNRLFQWLRENGYLIKSGRRKNDLVQRYLEIGLFEMKETTIHTPKGDKIRTTTLITGKGQMYFVDKLSKDFRKVVVA